MSRRLYFLIIVFLFVQSTDQSLPELSLVQKNFFLLQATEELGKYISGYNFSIFWYKKARQLSRYEKGGETFDSK